MNGCLNWKMVTASFVIKQLKEHWYRWCTVIKISTATKKAVRKQWAVNTEEYKKA